MRKAWFGWRFRGGGEEVETSTQKSDREFLRKFNSNKFNRTNDNIEWANWSWNPIVGCKTGCPYCYARDIANRFHGGFGPRMIDERLGAPFNTPIPRGKNLTAGDRNVFVCSMADMFGDWIPDKWIKLVLGSVISAPEWWNFLFLTKNPARLLDAMPGVPWPENCWVGTTVDCQARVDAAINTFRKVEAQVKFLSCEPLRERLVFEDLSMFDWVIVGAQSRSTREPARQPEWAWVEDLVGAARKAGCAVYFKPNLIVRGEGRMGRLKEWPRGEAQ